MLLFVLLKYSYQVPKKNAYHFNPIRPTHHPVFYHLSTFQTDTALKHTVVKEELTTVSCFRTWPSTINTAALSLSPYLWSACGSTGLIQCAKCSCSRPTQDYGIWPLLLRLHIKLNIHINYSAWIRHEFNIRRLFWAQVGVVWDWSFCA